MNIIRTLSKITDIQFLCGLLFFVLFFPQFQSKVGLVFEWIVTIGSFVFSFCFLLKKQKIKIRVGAVLGALILFCLILISIIRSADILIGGDLFELFKPVYFLTFFTLGYNIEWNDSKLKHFINYLFTIFLIISCYGLIESLTSVGNSVSMFLYKDARDVLAGKAIFSFISPYTFGSLLVFPVFYFYFMYFGIKGFKYKYIIAFIISLVCLFLTQSRTSFLSFILTFILSFIFALFSGWLPFRKSVIRFSLFLILIIGILFPIIIAFAEDKLSYLFIGLELLFKQLENFEFDAFIYSSPSISLRYEQLLYAIENQDNIPIIGVAIGKAVLMPESFFAMYLFRVGILGIIVHLSFIIYTLRKSYSIAKYYSKKDIQLSIFFYSIFIYFISFFFSYFSSSVNDQTRTGFIFYILIAIVCYFNNNLYKIETTSLQKIQ